MVEHRDDSFRSMGHAPSDIDICFYVDNVLIFSQTNEFSCSMVKELKDLNIFFAIENNVTEYLGTQIKHKKDSSLKFSRPFILRRIMQSIPGI